MVTGLEGERDLAAAREAALILIGTPSCCGAASSLRSPSPTSPRTPTGAWAEVFLASSKTAQHRPGRAVGIPATGGLACPVAAWIRWRADF